MEARVIAITGSFGVLGSAVRHAAAGRAALALIDSARAPNDLGAALVLAEVDLTDPSQAESAMARVADQYGRIDALLNLAGGFLWQRIEGQPAGSWARMYNINVVTAANAARAAIPFLRKSASARIVNVGSAAALKPGAGTGAYAAAKCGVHALTQALAEELKGEDITVNAVLPSIIDTPANRADMPQADPSLWVSPEDLASVILFLASPESRAITGALIPVTGRV